MEANFENLNWPGVVAFVAFCDTVAFIVWCIFVRSQD